MAEQIKIIKVKGHSRHVIAGYEIRVDPDNPANEVEIPIYKEIWIDPYNKVIRYDDGT